ncbi:hypothetical protein CR513_47434, partial [Mucuna pruriens]
MTHLVEEEKGLDWECESEFSQSKEKRERRREKKIHLLVFATQKPESMSNEEWDYEHQQMSRMGIKFEDEILGMSLSQIQPRVVSSQMTKGSVLNKEMGRKAQGFSSRS